MKISEIIADEKAGAVLIRYRADSVKTTGTAQYNVKPLFTGSKRGWTLLDATTKAAMLAIYKALTTPEALAKFDRLPLATLVNFTWKHIKGAN